MYCKPMKNLTMGALYNQLAPQCLKTAWLGLLIITLFLFRSTLVVLYYLLMHTQSLFRVLRTVLSSQLGRVVAFRGFFVWIRSAALQGTALIMGSQAKVMWQL